MVVTQVVSVRFRGCRKGAEHRRGIGVHVRQCRDGWITAGGTAAPSNCSHDAKDTPFAKPRRDPSPTVAPAHYGWRMHDLEPTAEVDRYSARKSRDRHGRGMRGPLIPPALPGWRTRADKFDDIVLAAVGRIERYGFADRILGVEFAVEDVPPSDPPPWEQRGVLLSRLFPAEPRYGRPNRIVLYRRPITDRAASKREMEEIVRGVLAEEVGHLLGMCPEEVDPGAVF